MLQQILSENSYMIVSAIMLVLTTMFGRMIIKIFRLGVNFNSELAKKDELAEYKREIREELKCYKNEITDVVMQACFKILDEKLKEFKEFKELSDKMALDYERISIKANDVIEKYNELKNMGENLRVLNLKVQELQYGQGTISNNNGSGVRRSV